MLTLVGWWGVGSVLSLDLSMLKLPAGPSARIVSRLSQVHVYAKRAMESLVTISTVAQSERALDKYQLVLSKRDRERLRARIVSRLAQVQP